MKIGPASAVSCLLNFPYFILYTTTVFKNGRKDRKISQSTILSPCLYPLPSRILPGFCPSLTACSDHDAFLSDPDTWFSLKKYVSRGVFLKKERNRPADTHFWTGKSVSREGRAGPSAKTPYLRTAATKSCRSSVKSFILRTSGTICSVGHLNPFPGGESVLSWGRMAFRDGLFLRDSEN